jgi:calpain-7
MDKESALGAGDFLTLHVYRGGAKPRRVFYTGDDVFVRGLYSNNPHNLTRFDMKDDDPGAYTLVVSQFDKTRDVRYTLSVFSTAPFRLGPAPALPDTLTRLEVRAGPISRTLRASELVRRI